MKRQLNPLIGCVSLFLIVPCSAYGLLYLSSVLVEATGMGGDFPSDGYRTLAKTFIGIIFGAGIFIGLSLWAWILAAFFSADQIVAFLRKYLGIRFIEKYVSFALRLGFKNSATPKESPGVDVEKTKGK